MARISLGLSTTNTVILSRCGSEQIWQISPSLRLKQLLLKPLVCLSLIMDSEYDAAFSLGDLRICITMRSADLGPIPGSFVNSDISFSMVLVYPGMSITF
jgi:hypothetical protein